MSVLDGFHRTAYNLITRFGSTQYYVKRTVGTYNPATSEVAITEVEIPIKAVIMDLTLQSNGNTYRNGTLVEAGDKQCMFIPIEQLSNGIPAINVDPTSDYIRVNGENWKIITSKETNPSTSENIYVDLYMRKA